MATADNAGFPGVVYTAGPRDKGYSKGARFYLEQFDSDTYAFKTRAGLDEFISLHGFVVVTIGEMKKQRVEYDTPPKKNEK